MTAAFPNSFLLHFPIVFFAAFLDDCSMAVCCFDPIHDFHSLYMMITVTNMFGAR